MFVMTASRHFPQRKALVTGLMLAFATSAMHPSSALATIHSVLNCNDSGPGSLRELLKGNTIQNNDRIDLSALACTITLNSGLPTLSVDNLTLHGSGNSSFVLDGNGAITHSRVLTHSGSGTLTISDLSIINGAASDNGGCIQSIAGSVTLTRSTVSGCLVDAINNDAGGGGIYARAVQLIDSTVSNNRAVSQNTHFSRAGGIFTSYLDVKNSTIRDNSAINNTNPSHEFSGGAKVIGRVTIEDSTISGNQANTFGGLDIAPQNGSPSISNSTISGNRGGGVSSDGDLILINSTIAFNQGVGVTVGLGFGQEMLTMQSTLIANNFTNAGAPLDLQMSGSISSDSANNLIVASDTGVVLPADTQSNCPKLEPLANNGGTTKTHALHSGSPAINTGTSTLSLDQRGIGFPRAVGAVDIGAYERQANAIDERVFFSGFESGCNE